MEHGPILTAVAPHMKPRKGSDTTALVTGNNGLLSSEGVRFLDGLGRTVYGAEHNGRWGYGRLASFVETVTGVGSVAA